MTPSPWKAGRRILETTGLRLSPDWRRDATESWKGQEPWIGGCVGTRTLDPLIKSQLLYHLSYAPDPGGSLAKLTRPV